jgi:hypothetical protein
MRPNRATHSDPYATIAGFGSLTTGLPLVADAPHAQRAAIAVYVAYRADPVMEPPPNAYEVRLIAMYLDEYIHAPVHLLSTELAELRRDVEYIRTLNDLANWLWDARRIRLEPL